MSVSSNVRVGRKVPYRSPLAERYDALVRRLQSNGTGWNASTPRCIGVTSCDRHEGASTVAASIAASAAEVTNGQVLLVDANIQNPAVGRLFSVNADQGWENVLTGECSQFDCVQSTLSPNLSVMLAGVSVDKVPAYDGETIDELLDSLKHVFRLVVFDLPPATEYSTCYSIAAKLDGTLLVIDAEHTARVDAQNVTRQLSRINAKLLGVVFNKCVRKEM